MEEHLLTQVVRCPTRGDNILDLFLTNNDRYISSVTTDETSLSDHRLVTINLTYDPTQPITHELPYLEKHSFQAVDYHDCDYTLIIVRQLLRYIRAVKLWNTLPKEVNSQATLIKLKTALGNSWRLPDKPWDTQTGTTGVVEPADSVMTVKMPASKLINRLNR